MKRTAFNVVLLPAAAFAIALVLIGERSAQAAVFDQIGTPHVDTLFMGNPAYASQFDTGANDVTFRKAFATAYDNFSFANNFLITNFEWVGWYQDADFAMFPLPSSYEVSIYADAGLATPQPAAAPLTTYAGLSGNAVLLPNDPKAFLYSADVSSNPFPIMGGTTYWFSVIAVLDSDDNEWGFGFSTLGDGRAVQDFGENPNVPRTRFFDNIDTAFRITAVVPEPSSFAFLTLCGGLVAGRRRRRV